MTLLIAILVIYGLGLSPWLYLAAAAVWLASFLWRERTLMNIHEGNKRAADSLSILRDRFRN